MQLLFFRADPYTFGWWQLVARKGEGWRRWSMLVYLCGSGVTFWLLVREYTPPLDKSKCWLDKSLVCTNAHFCNKRPVLWRQDTVHFIHMKNWQLRQWANHSSVKGAPAITHKNVCYTYTYQHDMKLFTLTVILLCPSDSEQASPGSGLKLDQVLYPVKIGLGLGLRICAKHVLLWNLLLSWVCATAAPTRYSCVQGGQLVHAVLSNAPFEREGPQHDYTMLCLQHRNTCTAPEQPVMCPGAPSVNTTLSVIIMVMSSQLLSVLTQSVSTVTCKEYSDFKCNCVSGISAHEPCKLHLFEMWLCFENILIVEHCSTHENTIYQNLS